MNELRKLMAEMALRLALALVPKNSNEGGAMIDALEAYYSRVLGRDIKFKRAIRGKA